MKDQATPPTCEGWGYSFRFAIWSASFSIFFLNSRFRNGSSQDPKHQSDGLPLTTSHQGALE